MPDERAGRVEPTLLTRDWNEEWKALQAERRPPDDPRWWAGRARHFRARETGSYARDFLALAKLKPGESVLDMGCGSGTLAIPLARDGHRVLACDFSRAMLDTLGEGAERFGVGGLVERRLLAWDDDWDGAGIAPGSVDAAFASRSIATRDLEAALRKLDRSARRLCAITLVTGASPRVDAHVMAAIGASVTRSRDYVYALNILIGMGRYPELRYIRSPRRDTFDTLEEGVADFARMLEGGNEDRLAELRDYLEHHMVENPDVGRPGPKGRPQGRFMLDHVRIVRWAFISWNPCEEAGGDD